MSARVILLSLALSMVIAVSGAAQQSVTAPALSAQVRAEKYYRTELYMGRSIPGGGLVSEEAWERFLADTVTPLFPDGFTVLVGRGQYREASGTIAKEPSNVLVFLYRKSERKAAGSKIETIRREYKRQFTQESVMRVDITKSIRVSF